MYEDARHAYLNEVLIRRVGCSAALAVIYGDVMRRLLLLGALNFGVRVECSNLNVLPTAEVKVPTGCLHTSREDHAATRAGLHSAHRESNAPAPVRAKHAEACLCSFEKARLRLMHENAHRGRCCRT